MDYRWLLLFAFPFARAGAGCGTANLSANQLAPSPTLSTPPGVVIIPPDSPKLTQIRVEPIKLEAIPAGEVTAPGKVEVNLNRISRVPLPVAGRVPPAPVRLGRSGAPGPPRPPPERPQA